MATIYYRMLVHQTKQYLTSCYQGLSFEHWIVYLQKLDFDEKRMADLFVLLVNFKLDLANLDSFKSASKAVQ